MPSAQVPLWVPILVGLLGMAGVVGGQLIAGRREDRRWRREVEREELRWRRERERERETRNYEGRESGYAELIGAVEAFDFVLYQARRVVKRGEPLDPELAADLRRLNTRTRDALGLVTLHAPEPIRRTLRNSVIPRFDLTVRLLEGRHGEQVQALWAEGQRAYRLMRAAMRQDLGLDAEKPEEILAYLTKTG